MTNRKVNYWLLHRKETYEPENSPYRKNSEKHEYFVVPSRYPRMRRIDGNPRNLRSEKPIPRGWVDISGITGPVVRKLDDGYLRQRLSLRKTNISYNQAYIKKVINNPKTPQCNRDTAIRFVRDHPELFIPRPTNTGDPQLDRFHTIINGDNPDDRFISFILRKC